MEPRPLPADQPYRYALYAAPDINSQLHRWAAGWLGWDPAARAAVAPRAVPGIEPARQEAMTRDARRYGFHATLKAPFRLREGTAAAQLLEALDGFAARTAPVVLPALRLADLHGFLALRPDPQTEALDALAAACVREFDRFRAPPGEAELAKRHAAGLSPRQQALLAEWGYPYVMDEFRLHFTLTARLDAAEKPVAMAALAQAVAPFTGTPFAIDAVYLFVQPAPDAPFCIDTRFALRGTA